MADNTCTALWSRHIKGVKEKADFIKYVLNSRALLDRMESIIEGFIEELDRRELLEDYSSPSWSQLQADRLGQRKAYARVLKLLMRKGNEEIE